MKKLYICGLQGQGKGLLAQLLDGHPEIFLPGFIWCPGISLLGDDFTSLLKHTAELRDGKQEVLAQGCTAGDVTIKIEDHTYTISVGTLWRYLFKQNFSAFLIDSFYSDWSNLYSDKSADNSLGVFNFVEFLGDAINALTDKSHFNSIEELQDTIYLTCAKNYKSPFQPFNRNCYFLQQGFQFVEEVLKNNSNKKIVLMDRNPVSSAFMTAQRMVERNSVKNSRNKFIDKLFGSEYDRTLYSRKYSRKYKEFHQRVSNWQEFNCDIHVVDFDEMVLNTKYCMDKVARFLEIDSHEILTKVTLNGKLISEEDGDYAGNYVLGSVTHDPYWSLSSRQIEMLEYLFNGWNSELSTLRKLSCALNLTRLNLPQNRSLEKLYKYSKRIM